MQRLLERWSRPKLPPVCWGLGLGPPQHHKEVSDVIALDYWQGERAEPPELVTGNRNHPN